MKSLAHRLLPVNNERHAALERFLRALSVVLAPLVRDIVSQEREAPSAGLVHLRTQLGLRSERAARGIIERHSLPYVKLARKHFVREKDLRALIPPREQRPAPANDVPPDEIEAAADAILASALAAAAAPPRRARRGSR